MAPTMRLGDLLLRAGVVSQDQLQRALDQQERWGGKLGTILVQIGALSEDLLVKALSRQLNIPRADLSQINIPPPLRSRLSRAVCEEFGVIPVRYDAERRSLLLAVSDPFNVVAMDDLSRRINLRIEPLIAGEQAILQAIAVQYPSQAPREDSGLKLINNQGSTLIKKREEVLRRQREAPAAPAAPAVAPEPAFGSAGIDDARLADLDKLAQKQSRALRAVLELLIEKGVLTREEYLAWVNRR